MRLIELEVGDPSPAPWPIVSPLDAYHHRLPLSSTEPRAFCASFPCYEADICTFSVSTTESWRRAKEATR